MSRGKRDSEWLVIKRCLAIVRQVQQGPASRAQLLEAMLAVEHQDAAFGDDSRRQTAAHPERALVKRLEYDLARIRDVLGVDIRFDRKLGAYDLKDTWLGLINLPDDDLATIAWLEETFALDSLQHDQVHALLGRLRLFMSLERRGEIERQRSLMTVDLRQRDDDDIASSIWDGLGQAISRRQRVAFAYLSPRYADGVPRRHVVEAFVPPFFDAVRGDFYFRGWCLFVQGPGGRANVGKYRSFRLGRMSQLEILPEKLPPYPPHAPRYQVVYRLSPEIARLGVSRHPHIAIEQVERQQDGGAIVRGSTDTIFWAVQDLMHYCQHCQVLGGPELLAEVRETVQKMAEIYG